MRAHLAFLFSLAVATCAGAAVIPPGTTLDARQELVRNNGTEPESLDPAHVESFVASDIVLDLFEGLTATDPQGNPVPGVAESWKQVDATTWVFKLRANAQWSNGQPVTAGDFVYSWRRLYDPKTAAKNASASAAYFLNAVQIIDGRKPTTELGVRAIDKLTLEVKTPGPLPFLPSVLALPTLAPQPQAVVEKYGNEWTKPANIVSNGAFRLKDWQVNSKVVVDRSPGYWDAAHVQLARVTFLCVEDTNADLKLYQSGEEDIVNRIPAGAYESLKAQYPGQMRNSLLWGTRFYALNNADPLLKDVRVRKALSMVLDRDILARKVTADGQAPSYGLAIKGVNGFQEAHYDWADWPMEKRVAEARKLIAEAAIKPGTHLKLTYYNSDYQKRFAVFTASEWKTKLGLDTDLDSLEFKVSIARMHEGAFQMTSTGWVAEFNEATLLLPIVQCNSDANVDRSCNRQADALIAQANQATDPARRTALLTQAARLVMDDYPLIPTVQYSAPRLVKPWVGGYVANGSGAQRSKDLYMVKH